MASSATQAGPVETAIREKVGQLWQSRAEPSRASRASFSPESRELTPSSVNRQLTAALAPSVLEISNDSAAHRHHAPMRAVGGGSGETHFSVHVVSDKFQGLVRFARTLFRNCPSFRDPDMKAHTHTHDAQRMIARHRLVNDSLKDEFAAGLHALSIKAKSPEEYEAAGGGI